MSIRDLVNSAKNSRDTAPKAAPKTAPPEPEKKRSGRPPGSKNKATLLREAQEREAQASGKTGPKTGPVSNVPEDAVVLRTKSGFAVAVISGEYEGKPLVRIAKLFSHKEDENILLMGKQGISFPKASLKAIKKSLIAALDEACE